MKPDVYNAMNREHIVIAGKELRQLIKNRITSLMTAHKALIARMSNEIVDKDEAVTLICTLAGNMPDMNERALFIKACAERAAYLETEIRELNTLGQTFGSEAVYRISLEDAVRFGI